MDDGTEEAVRLPGGETIPRRIELSGDTDLRPKDVPPVEIEGWEILDDEGNPTETHIILRTQPGEPGLSAKERQAVNLDAMHHNRVLFEVWRRTTMIRAGNMTYPDLRPERQAQASHAMKVASRGLRAPRNAVKPATLAEVLDAFKEKGIGGVTAMGYSRTHAYRLVKRAREELGR
jgi:hypothetical protein